MESLNQSVLRLSTRWENIYKWDVEIEKSSLMTYTLTDGYSVYILRELSSFLNFSYILVPEVGTYDFNKTEVHKIDLFVGVYKLILSRAKLVDPTFVTSSVRVVALMNHKYEGLMKDILYQPFGSTLWLTFAFCIALFCVTFWLTGMSDQNGRITFMESVYQGVALALQKSTTITLSTLSSRMFAWVAHLTVLILMVYYSGGMVSFFAVRIFEINSVETLVKKNYKILLERGYNNGSSIQTILESLSYLPIMKKLLYGASVSGFTFETFENVIDKINTGPSAHLVDEATAYVSTQNRLGYFPCTWSTLPLVDIKYPCGMYVGKKSRVKAAINYGILRLSQNGLVYRAAKRYWIPRRDHCTANSNLGQNGVSLQNVYIGFAIYGGGIVLSVLILIIFELNKGVVSIFCGAPLSFRWGFARK